MLSRSGFTHAARRQQRASMQPQVHDVAGDGTVGTQTVPPDAAAHHGAMQLHGFEQLRQQAGARPTTAEDRQIYGARQFAQENLARIHAVCESRTAINRAAALQAVQPYVRPGETAAGLLRRVVRELEEAPLTINLDIAQFDLESFVRKSGEYTNKFDTDVTASWRREPRARAEFEERLFRFDELYATSPHAAQGRYFNADGRRSETFRHESRPIYAALDFARHRHGGAHAFGRSHVVLADGLKHAATYLPQDSFLYLDQPDLSHFSTFFHLENLIGRMPDSRYGSSLLKHLVHQVRRSDETGTAASRHGWVVERLRGHMARPDRDYGEQNNYIDAAIHAPVSFRDVRRINLSTRELHQRYPRRRDFEAFVRELEQFNAIYRRHRGDVLFALHE